MDMSVHELTKQPQEHLHTPTPARTTLSQRKCACGGTPGPDGECAACKAKRLARERAASPAPSLGLSSEANQDKTGAAVGRPKHDFGKMSIRPPSTVVVDGDNNGEQTQTLDAAPISRTQDIGTDGGASPAAAPASTKYCRPTARFTSIPSGTLTPTFSGSLLTVPFDMNAEFTLPIPCSGVCGEYRQFVRGSFSVNGTNLTHALCSNNLSPTTWYEDCATIGGTNYKYGYHTIPFPNSRFSNPDQATGTTFKGHDSPGLSGTTGDRLAIHLEFKGILVDACDSDAPLVTKTWKVDGTGVVP
jgi:hypothetical protein